eukprot:3078363-Amphidinium_carterae.1
MDDIVVSNLLMESCDRLCIGCTGTEELLHGSQTVPQDASLHEWFGAQSCGELIECQLVVSKQQKEM